MSEPKDIKPDSGELRCYAFRDLNGTIDLDSIAETEDGVKLRSLEGSMGWRFDHPSRYSHDEEWKRLLTYGSVVRIRLLVEYA